MDERQYRFIKWAAITLALLWVGWTVYDGVLSQRGPGDNATLAGDRAFSDGHPERAERRYREALAQAPKHRRARRGLALALMEQGRYDEALAAMNEVIRGEPDFAGNYANRGILHDRMGRHLEALHDYERALVMDPGLADGPGWLTRFIRLQSEPPPTIADRAAYLRQQLQLPEAQRELRRPAVDEAQRPWRQ
ncbi:tetratricopeptide repeat protein [Alkalilimnicola ehrlichii MLHE-1]|uniref:TPR repeat-containing protein n=1 Tax=Alkalilimnicola ehrlichii (strain ATCC BAA-1101 / DSM 17681 / MLHE-1) TaxID=187272 RepID=Q0AAW1_ALKEH|nr:tetratricopeptide repeat protein [Alkalilimnicola ehrlichii]ABI56026.1 TPR repeat-containing protein [Alkalilimnicola ehrlichii MLHE-1]